MGVTFKMYRKICWFSAQMRNVFGHTDKRCILNVINLRFSVSIACISVYRRASLCIIHGRMSQKLHFTCEDIEKNFTDFML